jgi:hypothetical protein
LAGLVVTMGEVPEAAATTRAGAQLAGPARGSGVVDLGDLSRMEGELAAESDRHRVLDVGGKLRGVVDGGGDAIQWRRQARGRAGHDER